MMFTPTPRPWSFTEYLPAEFSLLLCKEMFASYRSLPLTAAAAAAAAALICSLLHNPINVQPAFSRLDLPRTTARSVYIIYYSLVFCKKMADDVAFVVGPFVTSSPY